MCWHCVWYAYEEGVVKRVSTREDRREVDRAIDVPKDLGVRSDDVCHGGRRRNSTAARF